MSLRQGAAAALRPRSRNGAMRPLAALHGGPQVSRGWQVGAAAVIGVGLGHAIYGVAAALGVAALIDASPLLYGLLRWGGVAYMVWLAH